MRYKLHFIFCILLICTLACEKTASRHTETRLSGKWTERVPDGISYYVATLHSFTFTEDSFFAKIISWTDAIVILPDDPCPEQAYSETYVKGKYALTNDSIYFSGKLCDALYQDLLPACNGTTDYIKSFKLFQSDTVLILNADKPSSFGYGIILNKE